MRSVPAFAPLTDVADNQRPSAAVGSKAGYRCSCHSAGCDSSLYWTAAFVTVLFGGLYIILLLMFVGEGYVLYLNQVNRIGFWIHATTGLAYYVCGFLQFSDSLRRNYPLWHRRIGYLFYFMAILTSVGILLLLIGGAKAAESAVLWTAIVWPVWAYLHWIALVAIKAGVQFFLLTLRFFCR
jgi:hypothetical protein